MKRLLLLGLIGLVIGIGCYSEAEKAAIQRRKEFIENFNVELAEHGFTESEMTVSGSAAAKVKFVCDEYQNVTTELWGDSAGTYDLLAPVLVEYGFKKYTLIASENGEYETVREYDLTSREFRREPDKPEPAQRPKDYMTKETHDSIFEKYMDEAMELSDTASFVTLRRLLKKICNEHGYTLQAFDEAGQREAMEQLEEAEKEGLLPGQ